MANISWQIPDDKLPGIVALVLKFYPKPDDFTGTNAAWAKKIIGDRIRSFLIGLKRRETKEELDTSSIVVEE
jgi:hypothetical protein